MYDPDAERISSIKLMAESINYSPFLWLARKKRHVMHTEKGSEGKRNGIFKK
jgi:hypothetical protein